MVKDNRVVIDSYKNKDDVISRVRKLKDEGYQKEEITLYTNEANADGLRDEQDVDVETESAGQATRTEDDRNLWEQIKGVFSTDTYDYDTSAQDPNYNPDDDILYPYRDDITNGHTVIVVENYRGDDKLDAVERQDRGDGAVGTQGIAGSSAAFPNADPEDDPTINTGNVPKTDDADVIPPSGGADRDADLNIDSTDREGKVDATGKAKRADRNNIDDRDDLTEDEKIRLKEERLEVDKEEVQSGEVHVRKETKHDTETVEVPVEREEVVVERKPVAGEEAEATGEDFDEETESYNIPVKEEEVEVKKKPVVKEEVNIKKKRHDDVEEVSEDVRREELDIDSEGRTGADGSEEDLNENDK